MSSLFARIEALFVMIPMDLIALLSRIGIGTVFLRSGLLKLEGWDSGTTLTLFQEEYKLPIIPPEIAAYMATAAELTLPPLLFIGLFTRYAAAAMLGMTLVIQIFVYPNAFDTHATWAVCLLFLMKYGAGSLSLDRALRL
jgi:putative oxidoreductase